MKRTPRIGLGLLAMAVLAFALWKRRDPRDRRQELAQRLKQAGYKEDDAGRIIFRKRDRAVAGLRPQPA